MDDNKLTEQLLKEMIKARKSRRRRFWIKTIIFSAVGIILIGTFFNNKQVAAFKPHVGLVQLKGVIAEGGDIEAQPIIEAMTEAMKNDLSSGLILEINSPGGSPVQSALIYDEIKSLRNKYQEKPVHCLVTDLAASGGYYVAAACENIYANRTSLVGSIGVILSGLSGFGFTKAMENLGVERRLLTAGEYKGFLDPFSPVNQKEKIHTQAMLDNLHQEFIDDVKQGRGSRLSNDADLFSGFIWSAKVAMELGLIDGFSNRKNLAKNEFNKANIYDYTPVKDPFAELLSHAQSAFKSIGRLQNIF